MKIALCLLAIFSVVIPARLQAQANPNAAEIEQLKKMGERMKHMTPEQIMKAKDSLLALSKKMNVNTNRAAQQQLDKMAPGTKQQNKDLLNIVRNRRYDTTFTIVDFICRVTIKNESGQTESMLSGTTEQAVVLKSGTSQYVYAEGLNPEVLKVLNSQVAMKAITPKYAKNYQSLKASGVYKKSFSFDGHTINEVGSEIDKAGTAAFTFQYDATQQYSSVGAGGGIKVHGRERLAEGAEEREYDVVRETGAGAASDLAQAKIAGLAHPDNNGATPAIVVKTPVGFRITYFNSRVEGDDDGKTYITEELTAYIGEHLPQWEAVIKPVEQGKFSYEHWLPGGPKVDGSDDRHGDDSLKFYIVVRDKVDTTKIYPGTYTIDWALNDVTSYPGFCNNYPAYSDHPNTDHDIVFSPELTTDPSFDPATITDRAASTRTGKGRDARVAVVCMDYGGWAKLAAAVTLDNGIMVQARPYYSKEIGFLTIPFDKDENKIADYWEEKNKVFKKGFTLSWDDDNMPDKQRDNGDGYTLLEEYRGFATYNDHVADPKKKYVHVRTDPFTKDAFAYDPDKLFYLYYEGSNPSKFNWHYLSADKQQFYYDDNDQLRANNRWVNFNKVEDAFYAEQFALVIKESKRRYAYDPLSTGIAFTALEWRYAQSQFNGQPFPPELIDPLQKEQDGITDVFYNPMRTHVVVEILTNGIADKCAFVKTQYGTGDYNIAVDALTGNCIRHEVGHFLGISHHGPERDGGSENCVMRYFTNEQRKDISWIKKALKVYCKEGEEGPAYEHIKKTDAGKNEEPYDSKPTGASSGDNCYRQITGKSGKE